LPRLNTTQPRNDESVVTENKWDGFCGMVFV
jgi:hypothetical protein